jgi:hypothetical protein
MNDNSDFEERPMIEILHGMQSDGLIRSYEDDQGDLRWTLTDLGRARADETETASKPASFRFDIGHTALVGDVVVPDKLGTLIVDIGPAVRIQLSERDVPDEVELGLMNVLLDQPHVLEAVPSAHPRRVRMDIGMNQTRMRSRLTKAEFKIVDCSVEFAGLFDLQGRLRCYAPLVAWTDGVCRAPRWRICTVAPALGEGGS